MRTRRWCHSSAELQAFAIDRRVAAVMVAVAVVAVGDASVAFVEEAFLVVGHTSWVGAQLVGRGSRAFVEEAFLEVGTEDVVG